MKALSVLSLMVFVNLVISSFAGACPDLSGIYRRASYAGLYDYVEMKQDGCSSITTQYLRGQGFVEQGESTLFFIEYPAHTYQMSPQGIAFSYRVHVGVSRMSIYSGVVKANSDNIEFNTVLSSRTTKELYKPSSDGGLSVEFTDYLGGVFPPVLWQKTTIPDYPRQPGRD